MKQEIEVPSVGESVTSGFLTAWLKQEGEYVKEGEDLFELETDKATMAVPAPASGALSIGVKPDTEVEVGQVVGSIDTDAEAGGGEAGGGEEEAEGREKKKREPEKPEPEKPEAGERARREAPERKPPAKAAGDRAAIEDLSPAVRRLVEENDLDPSAIEGTGKGGRITKEDVQSYLEAGKDREKPSAEKPAGKPAEGKPAEGKPSTKTGPGPSARQTRQRMSNLRRTVAEHLVASKQNAAHLTTFNEADMSEVMALRSRYRDEFEKRHGVRLGFMSFFVKAAVRALQDFPAVNAYIDGEEIVYNNYYNIGVAVSTERGLVVPVVRDADSRSFADLEREILDLATRARDRKLSVDEMTGGTFTITNGGVFGSLLSTPIPNPPQTGVLGMHTIQKRPVAVDDQVVIRPMMYLALTYDHRLIDGREAVSFLVRIKQLVEDPNQLLLDL